MQLVFEGGMYFLYGEDGSLIVKAKRRHEFRSMTEAEIIKELVGDAKAESARPRKKRATKPKLVESTEPSEVVEEQKTE